MIRKNRGEISWLEFELLQKAKVKHAVFLKQSSEVTKFDWFEEIVYFNQVHGKEIALIEKRGEIHRADGGITKMKEIPLAIKHADCQAAIFYDPVQNVLANVHAGWRGLVQNIYRETVEKMVKEFCVDKDNLVVCIGPSLEPNHSEFIHYKQEFPKSFWRFQVKPNYFNLWDIAKFQLRELGVPLRNIEVAEIGTYGNCKDFYSYRRDKTVNRNVTVAALS